MKPVPVISEESEDEAKPEPEPLPKVGKHKKVGSEDVVSRAYANLHKVRSSRPVFKACFGEGRCFCILTFIILSIR